MRPLAAIESRGEMIFKGTAIGQASQFVMQGQPPVAGDLLFQHYKDHADGDERLLHVPDVGGDIGIGPVGNDKRMQEEEEGPDGKTGDNSQPACTASRQFAVKVDGGEGVDDAEAPIDRVAISSVGDKIAHREPAGGTKHGDDDAPAQKQGCGNPDDEAQRNPGDKRRLREQMQAIGCAGSKQRNGVQQKKAKTPSICNLIVSRGPYEDKSRQEIAGDHNGVQNGAWQPGGSVKDVRGGLDESKEEPQKPKIRLSLRMPATKQEQDDDEDRQSQEIGKKSVVHQGVLSGAGFFFQRGAQ